jgi:hypothetical protein
MNEDDDLTPLEATGNLNPRPRSRRARRGVSGDIDDLTWETGQFAAVGPLLDDEGESFTSPGVDDTPGSAVSDTAFDEDSAESTPARADDDLGAERFEKPNPKRNIVDIAKAALVSARHGRGFTACMLAVAVLVVGALAGWVFDDPEPAATAVRTNAGVSLICPGFDDSQETIIGSLQGTATIRRIGEDSYENQLTGTDDFTLEGLSGAYVVRPLVSNTPISAAVQFNGSGHFAQAMCGQPMASQSLQFASTDGATVRLINPDQAETVLNITIFGPKGMADVPTLLDLKVGANSVRDINLADFAPGLTPAAVRIQTTLGRIFAIGKLTNDAGSEISMPTRANAQVIIPGVPDGATGSTLWLANPGTIRTKVRVDALSENGRVTLAGAESVAVEAGSTKALDLTEALQGDLVSLAVTTDVPIVASVMSQVDDGRVVISGALNTEGGTHEMSAPLSGITTMVLSNHSDQPVDVPLTFRQNATDDEQVLQVSLDPGSSRIFVPPQSYHSVRVSAPSQVVVAVITRPDSESATGVAVTPLFLGLADMGVTPIRPVAQLAPTP